MELSQYEHLLEQQKQGLIKEIILQPSMEIIPAYTKYGRKIRKAIYTLTSSYTTPMVLINTSKSKASLSPTQTFDVNYGTQSTPMSLYGLRESNASKECTQNGLITMI